MNRIGKVRHLFNLASVLCFVVCIAVIVLSIRSYYRRDVLHGRISDRDAFAISSMQGRITLYSYDTPNAVLPWEFRSYVRNERQIATAAELRQQTPHGLGFKKSPAGSIVTAPHWLLVLMSAMISGILRIKHPWRFSIRSLLIAMTFTAIVLGMAVAVSD